MTVNYALYATRRRSLPAGIMHDLTGRVQAELIIDSREQSFTYSWPGFKVVITEMPEGELGEHLRGFEGYVRHIYGRTVPPRGEQIISAIRRTGLVIGVVIEPDVDNQGRVEELIGSMCGGLHPMMFHNDAIYDWMGRLLLGRDCSFDELSELAIET